eukprot:COSAG02_NODE_1547_length_11964_cov_28.769794_4_plen_871_part_00
MPAGQQCSPEDCALYLGVRCFVWLGEGRPDLVRGCTSQGWKAKTDKASGKKFYYHKETKKTQWKRPTAAAGDKTASLKAEEAKLVGELAKLSAGGKVEGEVSSGELATIAAVADAAQTTVEELCDYTRADLVELLSEMGIGVVNSNRMLKEVEARSQALRQEQAVAMQQIQGQQPMNQAQQMQQRRRMQQMQQQAGYGGNPQASEKVVVPGVEGRSKKKAKGYHCCELMCCVTAMFVTLGAGVLLVLMLLMSTNDVTEHTNANHLLLMTGFFATLIAGSCVMCMMYLSPRYKNTEANGGRKLLVTSKSIRALQASDNWVWSMSLRVGYLKWPYVFSMAMFMVGLKFTQLFALTYDENAIKREQMPPMYVQIGDVVLLDIEALVQEDNSTFNAGLARVFDYAENANITAGDIDTAAAAAATQMRLNQALEFAAGEGAWDRMFAVFFCMCAVVLVFVCSGKICGCFTQGNGRTGGLGKLMIGVLKFVTSALFIPMYNHLIQALDCTYYERYNATSDEIETGLAWDAMPSIRGSVEYECYEGRHLALMLAAMLAICFFQWPVSFFLCTLPDSPPDPIRDVIIDEFVVHKKLAGRLKKVRNYETGFEWRLGEVPDRKKIDALKRSELRKQARKFLPQSVLDAIDDDETIDYREEVTKRLLGDAVEVPKLAYTSGCFSTLAEMYGTPATSPPGGQGRTGLLRDWAAGSRPCVVYKQNSPAWNLREELLLPKLELRRVVTKMGMDKLALDTLDARVAGCCHAGDDRQFDGIASVKRRPREGAIIFALDTYLVTIAAMYSGATLDVKSTRIKLIGLAIGHFMQCIFYCNPLIFLSGCCKCTPYDDKTGVQSRGSLLKMGYPYNYEPLNFVRAAGAFI